MSRTVAILGLGERGKSWSQAFHRAGWAIKGFDPDPESGLALPSAAWRRAETISGTVQSADWVAVCLPERLELLQKVMQRVQAEAPEKAIVAVASQAFKIDDVQSCAMRPASVIVAHAKPDGGFAFDVSQKSSVEVRNAAKATLAELAAYDGLDNGPFPASQIGAESA